MDELISKISDLFIKYGIKTIVMDDIARELGISKKTLYDYFENKTDILIKVVQHVLISEFTELDKLICQKINAVDQLQVIATYTITTLLKVNPILHYQLQKYYPLVSLKLISQRREFIQTRIKQNFSLGIEQGLYRDNFNAEILAVYYSNFLNNKCIKLFVEECNVDYDSLIRTILIISLRGIATSKGLEYIEGKFSNEPIKSCYELKNEQKY
jgi:AcrR family transcriptional regulator